MSTFKISLNWKNTSSDFNFNTYSRDHQVVFSGNQELKNSAAPDYLGNPDASNPEELLLSALACCHMLTFFAIASKTNYIIESYGDNPTAVLGKNDSNKISVTEITLSPTIVFSGEKRPTSVELKSMHDKAHHNCFIAQSIKTKVIIIS